jgi:hypothetical protein
LAFGRRRLGSYGRTLIAINRRFFADHAATAVGKRKACTTNDHQRGGATGNFPRKVTSGRTRLFVNTGIKTGQAPV